MSGANVPPGISKVLTDGTTIVGDGAKVAVALAPTAVTPGAYTLADITVDADGRITAAANGSASGSGTVTSVGAGTGLTASPSPITGAGTVALADTAVTPGSYTSTNLTVDQQGRITAASNGSAGAAVWVDTFLTLVTLSTGISTIYNDLNVGSLGNTTYVKITCSDGGSSVVTGFAGGTTPGQILIVHLVHGSNAFRFGNHELSAGGNQLETQGYGDFSAQADRVFTFMYDGTYWLMIGVTTAA